MKKKSSKKLGIKLSYFTSIVLAIVILLASILIVEIITPPKLAGNKITPKLLPISTQFFPVVATSAAVKKNPASPTDTKPQKPLYTPPQVLGNQLRVPILMYHYVGNNPNPADHQRDILSIVPDKFDEQMKYLQENGYSTISLDTFYAALKKIVTLPSKPVILTFDDGYNDFYYNAYPILRKYNLHATEFIPTGLIEQKAYLTWGQISEMQLSGLISFQAHSVHHYNLPSLSREAALYELTESKKILESKLGIPVNFMAYPYGATNNLIVELTKQAGYLGAAGTWPGSIQSEGSIYNIPRFRINGSIDLQTFIKFL